MVTMKSCVICGGWFIPGSNCAKYCETCRAAEIKKRHVTYAKKYYESHRDKYAFYMRRWRKLNPEKAKAAIKKYQDKHKEALKAYRIKWEKENHDYKLARAREYAAEHLEQRRIYEHNRRARIKGNDGELTPDIANVLFDEQGGLCYLCGKLLYGRFDDTVSIEHKIPVSRGGANDVSNIGLAHRSCNSSKYTKTPEEYLATLDGE